MATAWLFTLPAAGLVGAAAYALASTIGGTAGVVVDLVLLVAVAALIYLRARKTNVNHRNVSYPEGVPQVDYRPPGCHRSQAAGGRRGAGARQAGGRRLAAGACHRRRSGPRLTDNGGMSNSTEPSLPAARLVASCLAIASVAAAVIHFAVAGSHYQEYWVFGVFMLCAGWLQLAWAILAAVKPSRAVLCAGAVLNANVIAIYILTRTVGDMVGPTPNEVEPIGFGDMLCTVFEALILIGCFWLLWASPTRRVRRSRLIATAASAGSVTAVLLSVALVAGGPEMVMAADSGTQPATSSASSHMHMPAMSHAPVRLATGTPGGAISMPDPNMQMAPGMAMASSSACDARPTAAEQRAAVALVRASWRDASRFRSLAAAKAAGYRPITPTGLPVVHYLNVSYYLSDATAGRVLDAAKPQSLVYANTPKGAVLVAAMYITSPGGTTPQPGGCLTQWHVHTNLCLRRGFGVVGVVTAAHPSCPPGSRNHVTPPMMHIWFVPVPGGPTAIDASDTQVVRAAERVHAPPNGPA
jgi:hypothetical protein